MSVTHRHVSMMARVSTKEDLIVVFVCQAIRAFTANMTWTSVRALPVPTTRSAQISSTDSDVCARQDSMVGRVRATKTTVSPTRVSMVARAETMWEDSRASVLLALEDSRVTSM